MSNLLSSSAVLRKQILDMLMGILYSKADKVFQNQINALVLLHLEDTKSTIPGFVYKGKEYWTTDLWYGKKPQRLSESFAPMIDEILETKLYLTVTERPIILGFITRVLNQSKNPWDYVMLLPEDLAAPLRNVLKKHNVSEYNSLLNHQVLCFKEQNATALLAIKERLCANLLL